MSRLAPGAAAPSLEGHDHLGRPVSLAALAGRPVLVAFFRYASCPLCNLRVHQLRLAHAELRAKGLEILAVFQSPPESIAAYVGRQAVEFPLIGDPEQRLYRVWGVERGWLGLVKAGTVDLVNSLRALRAGYLPGRIDGPMNRLPADFLVDASGRLAEVHYGSHAGDHLPLARIHARLGPRAEQPAAAPVLS